MEGGVVGRTASWPRLKLISELLPPESTPYTYWCALDPCLGPRRGLARPSAPHHPGDKPRLQVPHTEEAILPPKNRAAVSGRLLPGYFQSGLEEQSPPRPLLPGRGKGRQWRPEPRWQGPVPARPQEPRRG